MNILAMMWKNLLGGSRTLLFPARPRVTERYRGVVKFDPELCTGCAICKSRCTSRAIDFKTGKGEFTWSYDGSQCTFCGRCVEGCKTHALHQESACPPVYTSKGDLKKSYTVSRKPPAPKAPPAAVPPTTGEAAPDAAAGGTK